MSKTASRIRSGILEHVRKTWPTSAIVEERSEEGPIQKNVPGFKVLRLTSRDAPRPIVYLTYGCFVAEAAQAPEA